MFDRLEIPSLLLFILPAVLLILVLLIGSVVRLRAKLLVLVALSRAALVAILLVLLAGPLIEGSSESVATLHVLVDLSRSIGQAQQSTMIDEGQEFVLSQIKKNPSLRLKCVAFAGKSQVFLRGVSSKKEVQEAFQRLKEQSTIDQLQPLRSDLSQALLLSDAGDSEAAVRARIIMTDGALSPPSTTGNKEFKTWLVAPRAHQSTNIQANALFLPQSLEEGEPMPLELTYTSSTAKEVEAKVIVDGQELKKIPLNLQAGNHQLTIPGTDFRLSAGAHEVLLKIDAQDEEPLDNEAGARVFVTLKKRVLAVKGDHDSTRAPAVSRALRAQGVDLIQADQGLVSTDLEFWRRVKSVVLDRVDPARVNDALAARIRTHVQEGGGVFLLPNDREDEALAWNRHKLFDLLPLAGQPTIKTKKPDEPKKKKSAEKLTDPDIKKSKVKEVDAPTLALLLVIDSSSSMKEGGRMVYAIKGAIATLRKLHPEDRIGVIAYNEDPFEVVPVQAAKNRERIERAIARIRPDGATDIKKALLFAQETLLREEAGVKSIVLLSDGFTRPFNVKSVSREILASGMNVITVGVGSSFDTGTLTQIAKYSGGTGPIPARNARQLPAVMVDVAARLIDKNNLRSADDKPKKKDDEIFRPEESLGAKKADVEAKPETKDDGRIDLIVERFTSYLDGIPMNFAPSIYGLHRTQAKKTAWVSLATKEGLPVLAHWRIGEGIAFMSSLAFEGQRARDLALWEAYSPLVAQIVRFCSWESSSERYELEGQVLGRRVFLKFDDVQARDLDAPWKIEGLPEGATLLTQGQGQYTVELSELKVPEFLRFQVTPPNSSVALPFSLYVPPPREVKERGLNLPGLENWAKALGGQIHPGSVQDLEIDLNVRKLLNFSTWKWLGLWWLSVVFAIELIIKRLMRKPHLES